MYIAGIPKLVRLKLEKARFLGMLNFRHRQLNSMTRELCVFAVGNSIHDDEFRRRVQYIFDSGLSDLFTTDKETGEQVLSHFNLRKAIAALCDVDMVNVPRGDVHDLLERYDTNLNGLDLQEFTDMLQDLIDTRTLLTDFESLETLTLPQLLALRAHDWDLPVYDIYRQRDDDHSELEDEEALEEYERILEAKEKAERQRIKREASMAKQKAKIFFSLKREEKTSVNSELELEEEEKYLPIRDRIAALARENMSKSELLDWVKFQAEKLDRQGKILIEPRTWAPTSSDSEKKAIQYLGFLFVNYRVDTWWFEVVIMFHKLFMTSVLAFIFKGSPTQLGIGFFATFTMLMIFTSYRPVANQDLMRLQIFAFTVQLLNLFLGIMLQTSAFNDITGLLVSIFHSAHVLLAKQIAPCYSPPSSSLPLLPAVSGQFVVMSCSLAAFHPVTMADFFVGNTSGDSSTTLTIIWLNVGVLVLPVLQILIDVVATRIRVMLLAKKLKYVLLFTYRVS
jgi:hypothetical protein